MESSSFVPVYGIIKRIEPLRDSCFRTMLTLLTDNGIMNFIISENTYVVDCVCLKKGMQIIAFYDANAPVPLIFPPQYQAVVIVLRHWGENVTFGYFDHSLQMTDGSLKLNLSEDTQISMTNGQKFICNPKDQFLIVFYTATTRSVPPQTTPHRIIVWG